MNQDTNLFDVPQSVANLSIYKSYMMSPYLSIKHTSYFQVYEELFSKYRNQPITFVEIGVLNGGSLFMWRDFLGPEARIIGVDLNPQAKRWEVDGFEIFIGNQTDSGFWKEFFNFIGQVDVVLDDGGHLYEQQIITSHCCIPNIRDGGVLVVEDTHTSYFKEFGFPMPHTFINWVKRLVDNLNSRFPSVKNSNLTYKNSVYSISIFESIVAFHIDKNKCFSSSSTSNRGQNISAEDYRHKDKLSVQGGFLGSSIYQISIKIPVLKKIVRYFGLIWMRHAENKKLKKYF
jgi:cephalosporin hydroxylase